jgi:glycosyltransferase involved in cell wall biosynthesis
MSTEQTEILVVVDAPNWAHDFKTRHLEAALGGDYRITKRYQDDVTDADIDRADLILVYYWLQIARLPSRDAAFRRNRDRLLLGVCSHRELEGDWRAPGLAMLADLPRAVFAVNKRLYDECRRLLDVPIFYTPNGVATDFFCPQASPSEVRARWSGFTAKVSALAGRIRGSAAAPSADLAYGSAGSHALRVGWAGSLTNHGPELRGFEDLIVPAVAAVDGVELVLAVREQTWRGPDEMREYYRSLDVYLCASLSEGTPNPCLEAAACGVPLVTTRVGCMPELVRDGVNGLFVDRQVSDIASKLALLRDDRVRRAELGRNMLASIREWDWKRMAENYRQMFHSILGGSPSRDD